MSRNVSVIRGSAVIGTALALLLFHPSCAKRESIGTRESAPVRVPSASAERAPVTDTASTVRTRYSVEDEVPGKTAAKPVELGDRVAPQRVDTFAMQEGAVEQPAKALYDIVYRIQVFASSDRAAAEKVKQRIPAETGLRAYLDFEDGLYKVRAGDFADRKEAVEARSKLVAKYPGSWIVMTTVRR